MSISVRLRAAVFGTAVTLAAVLVFVALLLLLVQTSAPDDQDKSLTTMAEATAAALATAPPDRLAPSTPPVLVDPATSSDPFTLVVAVDGTVLYRSVEPAPGDDAAVAGIVAAVRREGSFTGTLAFGGAEVRVHAVPWTNDAAGRSGAVIAGQSTAAVSDTVSGLSAFLVVATLFALVFALAVGWVVSGRALRPLRELVATTDEIGGTGDLSRRLPPNDTKDEVGKLTRSFNAMLDRLEASQHELAAALEAQRRFVADASHELRSPLTTIRSNAGFLEERSDASPEDRAEAIADIRVEADRMALLVDDLLALAQGEERARKTEAAVDLGEIAAEEARRFDDPGRPLETAISGDTEVLGDADMLRRLVRILIDNARKHGDGAVGVSVEERDGTVILTVTDRGPGFPDGELDRVFDRFYRADPARSGPGTGLGLAIARSIVSAHGGSIAATNRPEGGARVTVILPEGSSEIS